MYKLHQMFSSARHSIPRQQFEQELECLTATIKRIINELWLYFSAPIRYNREHNGYYCDIREGEVFEPPGHWFNTHELYALLIVQQVLEQTQPSLLDDYLMPRKRCLKKILACLRGIGINSGLEPPSSAKHLALSRLIKASKHSRTNAVFFIDSVYFNRFHV